VGGPIKKGLLSEFVFGKSTRPNKNEWPSCLMMMLHTHTPTAQKSDNSSSWKIEKQFCSSCSLFILNLSGVRVGVVVGWTEIHPSARQMKTVCFSDFHSAWNLIGKSNDDSLTHSNRFPF
jgi:hypothetical protein